LLLLLLVSGFLLLRLQAVHVQPQQVHTFETCRNVSAARHGATQCGMLLLQTYNFVCLRLPG
jgi:hypothetical protein